jgi:hypothetical protein
MAELSTQQILDTGLEASYDSAAAGGDTFVNDGSERQFLHVKNASVGSAREVTVAAETTSTTKPGFGTLTQDDIVVSVAASSEEFIGPFPLTAFGAEPEISYDSEADVTIAVVKI